MTDLEKLALIIAIEEIDKNYGIYEYSVRCNINARTGCGVGNECVYSYYGCKAVDAIPFDKFYKMVVEYGDMIKKHFNQTYIKTDKMDLIRNEDKVKSEIKAAIKESKDKTKNDKIMSQNPIITEYVDKEMSAYFWDNDNIEKIAKQVIILLASNDIDHVDDKIDDIISNNIEFAEFLNSWNNGRKIRKIADRVIQKYSKMLDKEKREKEKAESTAQSFIEMWKEGK